MLWHFSLIHIKHLTKDIFFAKIFFFKMGTMWSSLLFGNVVVICRGQSFCFVFILFLAYVLSLKFFNLEWAYILFESQHSLEWKWSTYLHLTKKKQLRITAFYVCLSIYVYVYLYMCMYACVYFLWLSFILFVVAMLMM